MSTRIVIQMIAISIVVFTSLCYANEDDICAYISQIKELPFKGERVQDVAYNRIITSGYTALPCLVAHVANRTPMPDPRKAMPYPKYTTVGDIAFFLFLDITNQRLVDFLPEHFAEKFKKHGVYAYFEYSEKMENRIELQSTLIKWLTEKK